MVNTLIRSDDFFPASLSFSVHERNRENDTEKLWTFLDMTQTQEAFKDFLCLLFNRVLQHLQFHNSVHDRIRRATKKTSHPYTSPWSLMMGHCLNHNISCDRSGGKQIIKHWETPWYINAHTTFMHTWIFNLIALVTWYKVAQSSSQRFVCLKQVQMETDFPLLYTGTWY